LGHIPQGEEDLLINMAVFEKKALVSQLCDYVDNDITYLDCAVVQKIIGYKWKDHAREQYINEFYIIMIFTVSYISALVMGRNNEWVIV